MVLKNFTLEVTDWIDECSVNFTYWHHNGVYPFIDDDTSNSVTVDIPYLGDDCSFYFEDLPTEYIYLGPATSVFFYVKYWTIVGFQWQFWIWDGSVWVQINGNFTGTGTIFTDITAILNTVEKINGAKLKLKVGWAGSSATPAGGVYHAWLEINGINCELKPTHVSSSLSSDCCGIINFENILGWHEEEEVPVSIKRIVRKESPTVQAEYFVRLPRRITLELKSSKSEKGNLETCKHCHGWLELYDYDDSFVDYVWIEGLYYKWIGDEDHNSPWKGRLVLICSST